MRRFLTAKGLLGAALVIAMVLVAIVAPLVIPADYGTRMTHDGAPPAALGAPLARHGPTWPRPLLSRDARRSNVARDRGRGCADEPRPRSADRDGGRLLSRRYRQCAHASGRHAAQLSCVAARADDQRHARARASPTPSSPSASLSRLFWRGSCAARRSA